RDALPFHKDSYCGNEYKICAVTALMNQLCKVCGEPAAGYHFGAFTCEGCKTAKNMNIVIFDEFEMCFETMNEWIVYIEKGNAQVDFAVIEVTLNISS
ncbi:unnamed protein product, partial [Medioppia subpectinata]